MLGSGFTDLGGPGTYVITVSDKEHTVEADSIEFTPDNGLRVWNAGVVTGVFSWYSSIIRKPDKADK